MDLFLPLSISSQYSQTGYVAFWGSLERSIKSFNVSLHSITYMDLLFRLGVHLQCNGFLSINNCAVRFAGRTNPEVLDVAPIASKRLTLNKQSN